MGLVFSGAIVNVPGLVIKSWHDDPEMRLDPGDYRGRATDWIRSIILHTTMGDPPRLLTGAGRGGAARDTVKDWQRDKRHAGSHLIIDTDGTVWCVANIVSECTYHATTINEVSVGIELSQVHANRGVYEKQYQVAVLLCDVLTRMLRIQRQFHLPYRDRAVPRLEAGGADCVGVFGHRDQSNMRGFGDPGDEVFRFLRGAGYQPLDFEAGEDLLLGRARQRQLVAEGEHLAIDGVLGPASCEARRLRHGSPLWTARPGD